MGVIKEGVLIEADSIIRKFTVLDPHTQCRVEIVTFLFIFTNTSTGYLSLLVLYYYYILQ